MSNRPNVNARFGRLVILHHKSATDCVVMCDCGTGKVVRWSSLVSGRTKSCGCLRKEVTAKKNATHGQAWSPTWRVWHLMKQRCINPTATGYKNYGGRGIKVCERWLAFENFLADMGRKPDGMTIERKDNNGNYEPENCVWADKQTQANNSRRSVKYNGKSLKQWAQETGIPYQTLISRMQKFGTIFPPHLINKRGK